MKKSIILLLVALIAFPVFSVAQNENLTGKISSNNHEKMGYATIAINGTQKGTMSDSKGFYKLYLPVGSYIIQASSVGFYTKKKKVVIKNVNRKKIMDFKLKRLPKQEPNKIIITR